MINYIEFKPTHYGTLHGFPVLLDMTDEDAPVIEAEYGAIGSFILDRLEDIFGLTVLVRNFFEPEYEPMYRICIKGEIE